MSGSAKLVTGSVLGHLVRQTGPLLVGVAAIMSVGLVDAFFIGRLGARELAAVSFIFPVITALSSLGVGIMAATSSVVSRALGRGDEDHAAALASLGIAAAGLFGLAIAAILYALRGSMFRLLQADEALLPLIDAYMVPYAFGFPLLLLLMGANGSLRAQGAAGRSMAIMISFAAANCLLDPLLIHGAFGIAGLGIAGAAYASIGGWIVGAVTAFLLLAGTPLAVRPAALRHGRGLADVAAIMRIAGPASFSNAINPIGLAVLTAFLAAEGQAAVAGFGAAGRLQAFALVPLFGLSGSIGAIVGQNWGAERYDRVRDTMLRAAGFCLAYGLAVALVLYLARDPLGRMFTDDPEVLASLTLYLEIGVWGYGGYGIAIVVNGALNAVDRAGLALLQSLGRIFLVMLPIAWLARPMLGAGGVFAGELVANLLGGAIAIFVGWRIFAAKGRDQANPSG